MSTHGADVQTDTNTQPSGPAAPPASDRLIRLPATLEVVGLGRSAWLDLVREKRAPQPVKIGRATLWVAAEVQQFVRDRIRQSRGG